jgi:diguanylate cyclase (GGDEF)-like protein/PAS domain S-box-containing protein
MTAAEADRFTNEAYLRAVFDTMLDGLVIIDDTGIAQVFNPACESMFGYRADEVIGRNVAMLMPSPYGDEHDRYLERYRETGRKRVIGRQRELEARRKDGTVFPIALSVGEAEVEGRRFFIGVIHDLTREVLLRLDAAIDPLTGMLNRRNFLARGRTEIDRVERYGRPCSMLMLDLDHFKQINDRFGHAAGDEALRRFAATCREILRKNDVLGRMGGEEFAVILPETAVGGGRMLAERLRKRVTEIEIESGRGRFGFTVSIGIAERTPGNGTVEHLLAHADRAMYEAKEAGRDRVVVANAP